MKILICGKGGTWKSTIAALLAKDLKTKEHGVLVINSDESNYGLSAKLGMEESQRAYGSAGREENCSR